MNSNHKSKKSVKKKKKKAEKRKRTSFQRNPNAAIGSLFYVICLIKAAPLFEFGKQENTTNDYTYNLLWTFSNELVLALDLSLRP